MAKVKTTTTKRTAPMKECPACGKSIHAAKQACGCGHTFAPKERAKRSTKGGLTGDTQSILSALDFVQKVGSIEAAQAALDALTKIKDTLMKTTETKESESEEIETP